MPVFLACARWRWPIAMLLGSAILAFALIPGEGIDPTLISGTPNHVLAFVALPAAGLLLWPGANPFALWTGLSAFGGAIELLQDAMELGRSADWADWGYDCIAAAAAIAAICVLRRCAKRAHSVNETSAPAVAQS